MRSGGILRVRPMAAMLPRAGISLPSLISVIRCVRHGQPVTVYARCNVGIGLAGAGP